MVRASEIDERETGAAAAAAAAAAIATDTVIFVERSRVGISTVTTTASSLLTAELRPANGAPFRYTKTRKSSAVASPARANSVLLRAFTILQIVQSL